LHLAVFPNDDAFNAAAGLFAMLENLMKRGSGQPADEKVRKLEGWIFGQELSLLETTPRPR
jgi:hypothetical protein